MADRKRKLEVDDSPAAKKQEMLPQDDPTGGINPYTGKPYSLKYYEILAKRKGVPLLALGPQGPGLPCTPQHGQLCAVPRAHVFGSSSSNSSTVAASGSSGSCGSSGGV